MKYLLKILTTKLQNIGTTEKYKRVKCYQNKYVEVDLLVLERRKEKKITL